MKYCPICTTEYAADLDRCAADGAKLLERDQWAPGTVIRTKYRIIGMIGRGGMGIVYKAEHLVFKDIWALKVMNPRLSAEPEFVRRFYFEAEKQRRLKHRNVVRVDDVDQSEDGKLFIGMEFVDGLPLRDMMRAAQGPLAVPLALNILRGIAEALEAADALGIVHRDIKPDNVLLERTPTGYIPKLTDFGVAKLREGTATISKAPLLTPQYAAPEQWQPQLGAPDGRTDLYALGVTAYEMLAGTGPFQGTADHELMYAHLHQQPLPPSDHNPEIAQVQGLDALILSLLEKDRANRPCDARQFLEELGRLEVRTNMAATQPFRGAPSTTSGATVMARSTPARVPTPTPAAMRTGGTGAAAAPARTPTTGPARRSRRYGDDEPVVTTEPAPSRAPKVVAAVVVVLLLLGGGYYLLLTQNMLPLWARFGSSQAASQVAQSPLNPTPPPTPQTPPSTPAHITPPPTPKHDDTPPPSEPAAPPPPSFALAANGRLREADAVHGLAFVSNSAIAVSTAEPALRIYDLPGLSARVVSTSGDYRALAYSHSGRLAGGSMEGTLQLWSATGASLATVQNAQGGGYISAVAFNTTGSRLASGSADGAIRFWTVGDDTLTRSGNTLITTGEVRSLAFNGDGQLASAAGSQVLLVSSSGASTSPLSGVHAQPWAVAFSPNGTWLAAGLSDGTVVLWRFQGRSSKTLSSGGNARINCVAFSRDSRYLIAGTGAGDVLRWDLDQLGDPQTLPGHHAGNVFAVAFSPDGNLIASGGLDRYLQLLQSQ